MRWFSTPESAQKEEISLLSILETIAAMAVALFIAVKIGTLRHFAVSACFAPLLLLRTEQSTRIYLTWSFKINQLINFYLTDSLFMMELVYHENLNTFSRFIVLWFLLVILPCNSIIIVIIAGVYFVTIRFIATIIVTVQHPIMTVKVIPRNWRRIILCTDIIHPPDMLPDMKNAIQDFKRAAAAQDMIQALRQPGDEEKNIGKVSLLFSILASNIPWYLSSTSYRWALKSTALIWSPLLWVITSATSNLVIRLKEIRYAAIYKAMRVYSLVVAALFLVKLYILWSWHEFITSWPFWPRIKEIWEKIPNAHIFHEYVVPPEIPIWQLAAFLNTILAWSTFYVADLLLVRYGENQPSQEEILHNAFRCLAIIRHTLSLYTIACTLYITVFLSMREKWNLPPLGTKLFPWW